MTVEEWLGKDNKLGLDIWEKKYRYNNESFDEWLDRVSGGNENIRQLIVDKKFLFGGRTLSNRGTGKKGSFSNCYSSGYVDDSLDELMKTATNIAMTFKAQGGQGISLSKVRPKGCGINNGQFDSDGIVPFMEIYNRVTESISQGGSRKGALIMSLDIWHKEAEDFIKIKSERNKIEKANLSLEIDDEFMKYVKHYYETGEEKAKEIHRVYDGNEVIYEVTPIRLYKLMMECAYDWAEPGCIFTNRFRNYNIMQFHDEYEIETCNPCGEQPLPKNGACNLGSINLSEFVKMPFTEYAEFNFDSFRDAVRVAVEGLDIVLDENMNNHPLQEQREMAYNYRNIGLGIMGLHDCLIKMNIKYGDEKSKDMIREIMTFMFREAVFKSCELAKEKGSFPKYNDSVLKSDIIKIHFNENELNYIKTYGLRNCSLLSIAPSGSIGTMLNVSTGCEPNFRFSYKRKTESLNGKDEYYDVYAGIAKEYIDKFDTCNLPYWFITSADIHWKDRIDIQSILQDHVDTAISSTVNLPKETTVEEIEKLYLYAWRKGLKGVTIFRDGCKRIGILTTEDTKNNTVEENQTGQLLKRGDIIECCYDLIGKKRKLQTGCGSLHVLGYFDPIDGTLQEVYLAKGSTGGCANYMVGLSRMISLLCRAGVDIYAIKDQLDSTGACPSYATRSAMKHDTSKGSCCPMAIGNALVDMYQEMQEELNSYDDEEYEAEAEVKYDNNSNNNLNKCPECGEPLIFTNGCIQCNSCSYTKCE